MRYFKNSVDALGWLSLACVDTLGTLAIPHNTLRWSAGPELSLSVSQGVSSEQSVLLGWMHPRRPQVLLPVIFGCLLLTLPSLCLALSLLSACTDFSGCVLHSHMLALGETLSFL